MLKSNESMPGGKKTEPFVFPGIDCLTDCCLLFKIKRNISGGIEDFICRLANTAAEKLLKINKNEIAGAGFSEIFPTGRNTEFYGLCLKACGSSEARRLDAIPAAFLSEELSPDRYFDLSISSFPEGIVILIHEMSPAVNALINREKSPEGFTAAGEFLPRDGSSPERRDIQETAEHKKTEIQFGAERELLQLVLHNLPAGVLLLRGKDLKIELVNDAYKAIAPGKEMEGKLFRDVWPEVYNQLEGLFNRVLETGETFHADDAVYMIKRSYDGPFEKCYFSFSLIRVKLPGGEPGILNTAIETTKQVNAYEAVKESEKQMQEAQRLAHVGSYIVDYTETPPKVKFSEEMLRILEFDPESESADLNLLYNRYHPEDFEQLQSKGIPAEKGIYNEEFDLRIVLPDKRIKYIYAMRVVEIDESDRHIMTFGTIMDITHQKLSELQLKNTLTDLERSNRELEQFAYIASHDLQEPLRMVSSFTKKLEMKCSNLSDEATKKYMHFIIDGAKRMNDLIQDLLAYSRLNSRKDAFALTEMNQVVAMVLDDLQVLASETGAKITCKGLPVILADQQQMKQLLQNLVHNAIKFRKGIPEIVIEAVEKKEVWLFAVRDNGIGINPEYNERIFVLFNRLHDREKYAGTGLGLAICRKIVERHGGSIWVESEEGKGSSFYFTIPK